MSFTPRSAKTPWLRPVLIGLVPLLLLICGVRALPPEPPGQPAGQRQVYEVPPFRTVVIILDSLGTPMAFDPELMPFVSSMMSTSLFGEAESCPGKLTFPCVKSIFEGRTATTGTALQDFSAVASTRTTWPASLAALGYRMAVTSDHTLNRLYPGAFVEAMNYESLHVPILERDHHAFRQAHKWLDDPAIDVLLLHIIGTDKVSHEYKVGGPEYRAKFREADDFVRDVAARLAPQDYLYVMGDHGHNGVGGHTEDGAYLARGPLFPAGRNANLGAADMLFLLSVPYALTLPDEYEGQIRTDLTLLPEDRREQLLAEQARLWRIETDGLTNEQREAKLNAQIVQRREVAQDRQGTETVRRLAPWLLTGALFLALQLRRPGQEGVPPRSESIGLLLFATGLVLGLAGVSAGGWIAAAGVLALAALKFGLGRTGGLLLLLAVLGTAVFWITPAGLAWFHVRRNQAFAWAVFYPLALLAGVGVAFFLGERSPRNRALRVLWTVGVAVWLLAYFGPYNYALPGRSTKVVLCILVPLAIAIAGGLRAFVSRSTLCLLGLLPFFTSYTASFNIEYPLTDRVAGLPLPVGLALCAATAAVSLVALRFVEPGEGGPPFRAPGWAAVLGAAGWLLVSSFVFQFDAGKLLGVLLASLWLIGCVGLFRRAKLPPSWFALSGVILLFIVFHFVMDGFALSHVDFRFAADKIIPFQEEWLRAPQLIAWSVAKYLVVLLPIFGVLLLSVQQETARQMLQLGWWRELMIIISALGLAIFDNRGMTELCSEEIYFWTFLNFALWLFWLGGAWLQRRRASEPAADDVAVRGLAAAS